VSKFTVERTDGFTQMLSAIQAEYPRIIEPIDGAEKYLRVKATECGWVSAKEGWRHYKTRAVPNVMPSVIIYFFLDEENKIARMMQVLKWD